MGLIVYRLLTILQWGDIMKRKTVSMNRGMIIGLALLATSILALNGFSQDANFHIYLAFGQSNMEGYPEVQASDKTGVNARFQLLPAVSWSDRTKGTWTTAIPPLCRSSTGLCPCDYFGRTLVDSLPATYKVGIINVSVAGCGIDMFDKDKYQSYISGQASWMKDIANQYGGNPYARLVEMAKAAQKDGVIRGILLHQGETDAGTSGWATKVKGVYDDLIQDLGLDASKTPLLAGDLVNSSAGVKGLPNTLQNSYVISSQGLGNRGDGLHFNAQGYRDIGKRYAITMLDILRKQGLSSVSEGNRAKVGYALGSSIEFKNGMPSFSFEIPERAFVSLKTYTLSGREIAELAGAEYSIGKHTLALGQKVMPKGVFVIKMKSGPFSSTRTVLACAR
jgi:hypothetical protein